MTSPQPNAFSDPGDPRAHNEASSGQHGLAAALSPLQAELEHREHNWHLLLSPMRAFDAVRCLAGLSDEDDATVLLFGVEHAAEQSIDPHKIRSRVSNVPQAGSQDKGTLAEFAAKQRVPVIDTFENDALVLEPTVANEIVSMIHPSRVRTVLVNGPIEVRDARDMIEAVKRGDSPLAVELRAVASIDVESDRVVRLEARQKYDALLPVAENFRHYLAAVQRKPHQEYAAPELWQLERLFDVSGALTVRPIETETYSTSLDVGISTSPVELSKPADSSLIYDLPSNTWHDEP